jgi:putative ABC transport system permease protein
MRTSDIIVLSLHQMRERKLRTVLTFLAVAVGVVSIVALSSLVGGVSQSISQSLETLGPNTIMVIPKNTLFTDADVARLASLEGVSGVTPILNTRVVITGLDESASLVGISSWDLSDFLGEVKLLDGDVYSDVPAPQALVGYNVAIDDAGSLRYKVGQPILVQVGQQSITMTVVGVLDVYGSSLMIQADDSVFVPLNYVKTFQRSGGYTQIRVKAENAEAVDGVAELIGYVFGGRASIISVAQITGIVTSITSQMTLLLVGITGVSFVAAGLGTFNIMMVSVLERVKEIGIVKALGMKDRGVLMLYMTQGLLMGLFGSATGVSIGIIAAYVLPTILEGTFGGGGFSSSQEIGNVQNQSIGGMGQGIGSISFSPVISPTYVGIAVTLSILVTLLSSAYPAWKASKMNPVDALRYE